MYLTALIITILLFILFFKNDIHKSFVMATVMVLFLAVVNNLAYYNLVKNLINANLHLPRFTHYLITLIPTYAFLNYGQYISIVWKFFLVLEYIVLGYLLIKVIKKYGRK